MRLLHRHLITQRKFFLKLTRERDFVTYILLDIEADYGFSEWVRLSRSARRKLRFETGEKGTALPGIVFWVGLNKKGRLFVTKTEGRGAIWVDAVARRKVAKRTLKAILKIVPPGDD
ncbi:MAG: hypothetical protein Q7R48_00685 [bacterium]|nr:hypothetical protein [bacterium]